MKDTSYKNEPRCKICSAKDLAGESIRDEIDAYATTGATLQEVHDFMLKYGIKTNLANINGHFIKHSPFVRIAKRLGSAKSRRLRMKISTEFREASEALQRVITIGDKMVENWAENKEGHQMPVTERLYIEALKEQGKRGAKTSIDMEMEIMDRQMIEGFEKNVKETITTKSLPKKLGVSPI